MGEWFMFLILTQILRIPHSFLTGQLMETEGACISSAHLQLTYQKVINSWIKIFRLQNINLGQYFLK